MEDEWLYLDVTSNSDAESRLRRSRRECRRAGKPWAVLCRVAEYEFQIQLELPPGKRWTPEGCRAIKAIEVPFYSLPGNNGNSSQGSGDGVSWWSIVETTEQGAREYLAELFQAMITDLAEERQKLASSGCSVEASGGEERPENPLPDFIATGPDSYLGPETRSEFGIPSTVLIPDEDWEQERRILAAAVNFHAPELEGFEEFVYGSVTTLYRTLFGVGRGESIAEALHGVSEQTISDFLAKNLSRTWRLPEAPFEGSHHTLLAEACDSFQELHRRHPGAQGLLEFARPGLNAEKTEAVVELNNLVDTRPLNRSNAGKSTTSLYALLLLRREQEDWNVVASQTREDNCVEGLMRSFMPTRRNDDLVVEDLNSAESYKRFRLECARARRPSVRARLSELLGFRDAAGVDTGNYPFLSQGETLWGVYRNRRHQPTEILFTDFGIWLTKPWTVLFVPYRAIEKTSATSWPYHLELLLYDGRKIPLAIDHFEKTDDPWLPQLDATSFAYCLDELARTRTLPG